MRSNSESSPRLLAAVCWSVLGVLFSIPASAHLVYLTGENYTWDWVSQETADNQGSASADYLAEVQPQVSREWGDDSWGVNVAGSYESQQQSSNDAFSFSARSSVSAEGFMSFDHTPDGATIGYGPGFGPGYVGRISQKFYYLEFLVTDEVLFFGNLALTNAVINTQNFEQAGEFGEFGDVFLSGSILGPGTYRYWSGSPSIGGAGAGFAFDGFAYVSGGLGTASSSSFTQFIDMRFTAVSVPTPSGFLLTLSGLGLALFARSRRFGSDRGDMQLVSAS